MASFADELYGNAKKPYTVDDALASEGVTGKAADFFKSIYQQESSSGKNTATSNRGAVGGAQIIPSTFKSVADDNWDIKNPEHNLRAGIRYAMQGFEKANGNPELAGAFYYGGPNGLKKAMQGVAVSDPVNPNAPNTLQYGAQVAARMPKPASRSLYDELYGDAPKKPSDTPAKPEQSLLDQWVQLNKNVGGGLIRGAGSLGATAIRILPNAMGGDTAQENEQRRVRLDENARNLLGADTDSWMYKGGKIAGEIAGTAGVGGLLAKGLSAVPFISNKAPALIEAIGSAGFKTGVIPQGAQQVAKDVGMRMAGGTLSGGAGAAAVDPNEALMGAVVGGGLPMAAKGAMLTGGALGSAASKIKNMATGNKQDAGQIFAKAMGGMSDAELTALANAAATAPNEIVPGSKFTFAQALEYAGKSDPRVKLLERTVSQGQGGGRLLQQYADQNSARIEALKNQGAQLYEGAPKIEAHEAGNLLGSTIRTQRDDAAKALFGEEIGPLSVDVNSVWGRLNQQANKEGTALQFPFDEMNQVVNKRLGDGYFASGGKDTKNALAEMARIGTEVTPGYTVPAIKSLPIKGNKGQNLEEAIRSMGGLSDIGYMSGELRGLGVKNSGTTGILNRNGLSPEAMAQRMYERGFIAESDPAVLLQALQNRGGKNVYSGTASDNGLFQRRAEAAMGDMPEAIQVPEVVKNIAVPFNQFQKSRSSAGTLAASIADRSPVESAALRDFEKLMAGRVDDASSGNLLAGERLSPEFRDAYVAARDQTKKFHDTYGQDKIAKILDRPYGANYRLNGDEIFNTLWGGGAGVSQDMNALRNLIAQGDNAPALDKFRQAIMTDAASKTTAAKNLESGFPKYVNSRITGLTDIMTPDQLNALRLVSQDIENSTKAQAIKGLVGSDTAAKISKAVESGILDTAPAKAIASTANVKAPGLSIARAFLADQMAKYKGNKLAELLANPKYLNEALTDFVAANSKTSQTKQLMQSGEVQNALQLLTRSAPALSAQ